ncbi:hypothetical protein [uncultured Chloroflexus sp.]|uniref:hypothetical protein n=1 Tax=uncultured Chloroflexus sp. TaxID=214040 RepID=UPI0026017605|nr:hypothetical protein [uncultured Chloroflexus sp.]
MTRPRIVVEARRYSGQARHWERSGQRACHVTLRPKRVGRAACARSVVIVTAQQDTVIAATTAAPDTFARAIAGATHRMVGETHPTAG